MRQTLTYSGWSVMLSTPPATWLHMSITCNTLQEGTSSPTGDLPRNWRSRTTLCTTPFTEQRKLSLTRIERRSGRPQCTTEQEDKYIRVSSLRNRCLTSPQLAASLNSIRKTPVSTLTVKRRLWDAGLLLQLDLSVHHNLASITLVVLVSPAQRGSLPPPVPPRWTSLPGGLWGARSLPLCSHWPAWLLPAGSNTQEMDAVTHNVFKSNCNGHISISLQP